MRLVSVSILCFLVLLPSWVCAMPLCASSQPAESKMPCHDQMDNGQDSDEGLMFLQDCLGVDYQVAEAAFKLDGTDKDKAQIELPFDTVVTDYAAFMVDQHSPRAPPPKRTTLSPEPSIVLTTQRFRI